MPLAARANCTTSGTTVTCDSSPPNPFTSTIGAGPGTPSGTTVTLGANAQIVVGNANAISVGSNATIAVGSGALVQNSAFGGPGLSGVGNNTVEFSSNSTVTIAPGGKVYSVGPSSTNEAFDVLGSGNIIDNSGTIQADRALPFFFERGGTNTIINETGGVIQGASTTTSVIGGGGPVNFTNKGQVIGSLNFSGGNDRLTLYTGSGVTGSISGGGRIDTLTLNGLDSGTLASAISNFEMLTKQDAGTWTLTGPIANGAVAIQGGTLVLTGVNAYGGGTTLSAGTLTVGNNSALGTGPLSMAPGTTLSFLNTGNFTLGNNISITGAAAFAPPGGTTQTAAGVISDGNSPGMLGMQGPGTLALSGANTYTGGTVLSAGTLAIGNNAALGTGGLTTLDGTVLQAAADGLSLANTVSLEGAATVDTQDRPRGSCLRRTADRRRTRRHDRPDPRQAAGRGARRGAADPALRRLLESQRAGHGPFWLPVRGRSRRLLCRASRQGGAVSGRAEKGARRELVVLRRRA
jgi:autotransporter-associated beta strand protein